MRRWIGIDPGLDGAIAVLDDDGSEPDVGRMPTVPAANGKGRDYDIARIRDWLSEAGEARPCRVVIERQQAMVRAGIKQGTVSSFQTGRGFGLLEGLCAGLGLSHELVHPRIWQAEMFRGQKVKDTKSASLLLAHRLFPAVRLLPGERARVEHHGMSDALLIAAYAMRRL